jgi:hypothetical protein
MRCRMATASTSASIADRCRLGLSAAALLVTLATPAVAGLSDKLQGHLSLGYGKLIITEAPGGSLSFAAGLDYPLAAAWRAGVEFEYSLLGTRLIERGSQAGELDYSVFDVLALLHWTPPRGPVGNVSLGPGVFHARADLTSSAPAAFDDLAVERTAAGVALSVTLMPRSAAPVRGGLELGVRTMWLPDPRHLWMPGGLPEDSWTLVSGRLTVHY